jgi:alkaline phosphatase D
MSVTRRGFLATTAAAGVGGFVRFDTPWFQPERRVFLHGVASGDPLADRVVLWTRISAAPNAAPEVRWEMSATPEFQRIAARGRASTAAARDFTVKVDAAGLRPSTTYYYRFEALGERSPIGRTRTAPVSGAKQIRLGILSCSSLPHGYFNVYRRVAERADLDAVLHLGDYIYEYANGTYGDGSTLGRIPEPNKEIVTLADYRTRYAQYRRDPDLQDAHRQHPFIVVWDDHEIANNTWHSGAQNHNPQNGEGEFAPRRAAAVQAYLEWMPIREDRFTRESRIYRHFSYGSLADLLMLDTRLIGRDEQPPNREAIAIVDDPRRSLLGTAQEEWLNARLEASTRSGVKWQILGQQVMFAPASLPGANSGSADTWDAYRPARQRLLDSLATQKAANVIVLTGDVHSAWAYDIAQNPWDGYDPSSGKGTVAVEIVTPSVTSPSGFGTPEEAVKRVATLRQSRPHLKYVDGLHRGYVVLDVTAERARADWFYVPTVSERTNTETFGRGVVSAAGNPHLIEETSPAPTPREVAEPAPAIT